jgi:predicted metalloendopeptidase
MPRQTPPLVALALLAALAAPALAAPTLPDGGDPNVRVQDDLFRAVNGRWLDTVDIPGDKKAYGSFMILRERSNEDVRTLLNEAAKAKTGSQEAKLVGTYYAALIDEKALERQGLKPLAADLKRIDGIRNLNDVADVMGALARVGTSVPAYAEVWPDEKNPDFNAVHWGQSGLGMPDRDYYLDASEAAKKTQAAYVTYLETLARLSNQQQPAKLAADVMAFETAMAKVQWSKVDRRDAVKTYNPAPRAKWASEYPGFPWARFAAAVGMPAKLDAIVNEPSYMKDLGKLANATPMATWKAYLKLRLLDAHAEHMGKAFRDAHHAFKGVALNGLTVMPPRWRTAVEETNSALGEAIGARYVEKHFPKAAKARMQVLVGNLLKAYHAGLNRLDWMTPETRKAAQAKLAGFRVKIGYPDKWRGYKGLSLVAGEPLANVMRAERFHHDRDMSEAGKPVDKSRWDMTPQTVNAYYSPVGNEIVFPAAILQPPFFDANTDDAFNYGAIGAVIGHEISHGFDDQGRRYDAKGTLRDWWSPADEKAFTERTAKLAAQYDAYEPLPGLHVNGRLTMGENIADLAGLKMALDAYHLSLNGKAPAILDGNSGEQRFFIGFARVWRSKSRPEWLRQRLVSDPHSPEAYRTNGVVTNLDAFYDAFNLQEGDKLYKKVEDRVRIW